MARDPGSVWKPLPEANSQGSGNTKTQFIVHSTGTMASAAANFKYFARSDVAVESTFIVGLSAADPTLQILDSTAVADANGSANRRGISVEVVGDGVGPYTDWQIAELVRLGKWAAANHPISKRIIPSEAASGFGWHVMFGAPGPWTSVRGKVCPGNKRIAQLKSTVFPAIFAAGTSKPASTTTTLEELVTMQLTDPIESRIDGDIDPKTGKGKIVTVREVLQNIQWNADRARRIAEEAATRQVGYGNRIEDAQSRVKVVEDKVEAIQVQLNTNTGSAS